MGWRTDLITLCEAMDLTGWRKITLQKRCQRNDLYRGWRTVGSRRYRLLSKAALLAMIAEQPAKSKQPGVTVPANNTHASFNFRILDGPPWQASIAYRREWSAMLTHPPTPIVNPSRARSSREGPEFRAGDVPPDLFAASSSTAPRRAMS